MRLHHLEITAFGPFADTVRVDFDELSDAGLFLLSGATGAGKTSVLDAVCFALYGDVPGDRNTAKRLRCDQAGPGVAPRVVLEATLGARRFRIERSPLWERPKLRGEGTTTQQSSVTLAERVDGEWRHLSSRLDETGHLISHLVGMTVTQFTQVAMLPQGRFQTFLRSRSEDRHAVLQQLFRTGRFADVERWLRDRRVRLRRAGDEAHQRVADLVSRVSETAESPLPGDWDIRDLTLPAADGQLGAWAGALHDDAARSLVEGREAAADAATAEATLRGTLAEARALHERLAGHLAAEAEHDRLVAAADEAADTGRRVSLAQRASGVAPLLRLRDQARDQRDRLAADVDLLEVRDRDQVAVGVETSLEEAARVRSLRPAATRLAEATTELGGWHQRQAQVTRETHELRLQSRLAAIDQQVRLLREHRSVSHRIDVARTAWHTARESALTLHESLLSLREARLDSMAGEIALALAVGACCPVCGSAEHPHKAQPSFDAPDAAAEKAALRAVDDAKATEHLRDLEVRDLVAARDRLTEALGEVTLDELQSQRADVEAELAPLAASRGGRAGASRPPDPAQLDEQLRALDRRSAEAAARIDGLTTECTDLRATLDRALAGTDCPDLDALLATHEAQLASGRAALRALDALAIARSTHDEARGALERASAEAGFDSPEAAAAAVLPEAEVERLTRAVRTHEQRLAAVREVLGAPGADELTSALPPDLPPLVEAHADALAALARTRGKVEHVVVRVTRLAALQAQLESALRSWAPLREDLEVTVRLAAFVEGKAPDNRLKMRLSAYVLAYRLGQVVAAANQRLASMSDQRYSLVHTGDRGAGETRGGLSLLVRDDWSGETRDPATLSGGETFVVSLALALGLADVITHEVGGAALDTLFVDEGFGSLDADTLDDVMDTLDALRDGGRVVGVVSHVAELRDRIPTQLVVTKSRSGSTVALRR
ncbi:SMC family ATPase [Nocardioides sp.]|uniref:SMC family ATPase n=1 Tax=Nocardioides sp. TaxID=35761 RepID=UPI00286B63F0|nr:SMC family ATPase [Nocardioides sp.]